MDNFCNNRCDLPCHPVIPLAYDQSLSYMEMICKIIYYINNVYSVVGKIDENAENIAELNRLFEEFVNHGFDQYYATQVAEWIANNLDYIYSTCIQQIFFGLSDDGYLVAYIPESWDEITFDTIMDCNSPNFGRLTLTY